MEVSTASSILFFCTVAVRLIGFGWVIRLLSVTRDWRVTPLLLIFGVLSVRGIEYVVEFSRSGFVPPGLGDVVGFLNSVLGLVAIILIGRMIEALQLHRRKDGPLTDLVENSGDFMGIAKPDGTVTYVNPEGIDMVGLENLDDAPGRKLEEFVFAEFRAVFREEFLGVVQQGKGVNCLGQLRNFRREGERIEVDCQMFPIRDPKTQEVVSIAWSARDITERKRKQAERNRLAAITESSPDAIIQIGTDGTISTWNRAAEQLYGYSEAEAKGQPIAILLPRERLGNFAAIVARLDAGEKILEFDTVHRRKDGSLVDAAATIFPFVDDQGKTIGTALVTRDISKRKNMELALRESETQFRVSFERAPIGVALANTDSAT